MSGLTTGRRALLIGLALVLVPIGIALPWVVHQLASNLARGPIESVLTFSPAFVPTLGGLPLHWTDFSNSFVWRGDLYFVDWSERTGSLRAWNLATGRSRFVAPFVVPDCERMMYFVHNDRLVVLHPPAMPSKFVSFGDPKERWRESSRYVGPFDYQGHPSVLAIQVQSPDQGSWDGSRIPPREVSATVLCFENDGWVERGEVPLPRSFADWNSTVTDAFQREGDVWVECRLGWGNGRTFVRRGLFPNAHDWNDEDERVTRSRSPRSSDATHEYEDSVSAIEPANVAEADWPRTARERGRWEAAALNQPASALDPENRLDWRGWQPSETNSNFWGGYDSPRWQSAREAEFASQQPRRTCGFGMFPDSQDIEFAARRDRSLPPRLCCESRYDSDDDGYIPVLLLNGREITINDDGRDIFSTWSRRGRKQLPLRHNNVISVEALDDRTVWLVARRNDGRIDLHRLDEAGAHRVASLAGPLPGIIARNAGLLFALLVAVPALLFLIVGFGLVRGRVERTYSFGHRTVELAPVHRRGLARLIDVAVILPPLVLGLFLNEDFGRWWTDMYGAVSGVVYPFRAVLTAGGQNPSWQGWQSVQGSSGTILQLLITAPVGWWPAWLSGALAVASLVAKARWGAGLGGWLCGVRVCRMTLRPCGLARCLTRELLLVVETLGGWLWISPLLMLALSNHSRRWGDRVSGTITVAVDRPGAGRPGATDGPTSPIRQSGRMLRN